MLWDRCLGSIMNIRVCAYIAVLLMASGLLAEQKTQTPNLAQSSASKVNECKDLGNVKDLENDALEQCRDTLEREITGLNDQLGYLRDIRGYYLPELANAKAQRDKARQQESERKISETEPWAGLEQGQGQQLKIVSDSITQKELAKNAKTQGLKGIDSEIDRRLNIERGAQDFKKLMSLLFAIIVGVVILCFFGVAWQDSKVRQEIFAGQAGIQFVTLFSLVIAIILFGITGVLDGKELGALLGGLAGYILGRSGVGAAPAPPGAGAAPEAPGAGAAPAPPGAA